MNLKEFLQGFTHICKEINKQAISTEYHKYGELSNVDFNREDANDLFLNDQLTTIMVELDDIKRKIDYLNLPIKYESTLSQNTNNQYQTTRGDEYHCGSTIEYLYIDSLGDPAQWRLSRVEHKNGDYYILGNPNQVLEGLVVRIRDCK